jgi:hypothetical protein
MEYSIAATFAKMGIGNNESKGRIEFDALRKVTLMSNQNCLTSACRYCRFFRPEGSHGGACQQLGVSVQSDWKSCQLGLPAFANTWENAEELSIANRPVEIPQTIQSEQLYTVATLELSTSSVGANN